MSGDDLGAAVPLDGDRLGALERLAEAATPGPWHHGDRQFTAGVTPGRFGEGRCAWCAREDAPLTWSGRRDINGTKMLAHVHTMAEPWHEHGIYAGRPDGDVIVVNDTDEYGYMDPADAEFIAATDPSTVLALVAALRASWAEVERLTGERDQPVAGAAEGESDR